MSIGRFIAPESGWGMSLGWGEKVRHAFLMAVAAAALSLSLFALGGSLPSKALAKEPKLGFVWTTAYSPSEIATAATALPEVLRLEITIGKVYPSPEDFENHEPDWTFYDETFTQAAEHGISILPYLYGNNKGDAHRYPLGSELPEWEVFVAQVVERYGVGGSLWSSVANPRPVKEWEVWNEPNLGKNNPGGLEVNPEKYAHFLNLTSIAIKGAQFRIDSSVEPAILMGGLFSAATKKASQNAAGEWQEGEMNVAKFVRAVDKTALGAYTALSLHPYAFKAKGNAGIVTRVREHVEEAHNVLEEEHKRKYPNGKKKPIYITELGWPLYSADPNHAQLSGGETQQAKLLKASFAMLQGKAKEFEIKDLLYFYYKDTGSQGPVLNTGSLWDTSDGLRDLVDTIRPSWRAFEEQTGATAPSSAPYVTPVAGASSLGGGASPSGRPLVESAEASPEADDYLVRGAVNPEAQATTYKFEYGTTTSYGSATPEGSAGSGYFPVPVCGTLSGLEVGDTYHFRLVATNPTGTTYGEDESFEATGGETGMPVAAFAFNEEEGEVAEDRVCGGTGTITGAQWSGVGRSGGSLNFLGAGSRLTVPGSEVLDRTDGLTLEAWVDPSALTEGAPLFVKEDPGAGEGEAGFSYRVTADEGGVPTATVRVPGGSTVKVEGSHALPVARWSFIAVTDNGAELCLYVEGKKEGCVEAGPLTATSGPLQIGGNAAGAGFEGMIDDVRVYDRALEEAEVEHDELTPVEPFYEPENVSEYPFDEGTGTVAGDIAGGYNGTVEGATWTTGKFGGALKFNGSSCVTVPDNPAQELREELTVEAWIKPEGSGEAESIVYKESEGFFGYTMFLGLQQSGKLEGLIGNDEEPEWAPEVVSPHQIPKHVWTHVAMTFDGHHERLYVNGQLVDTEEAEPPIPNNGPLKIGCAWGSETGFEGKIDEVRIYNRALSQGQIAVDANAGIETPAAGPVAAYSFDADTGSTLEDVSGHEHNGTIEGATWAKGKYGSSLEFDGKGDQVTIPDSEELRVGEEFTLEAWVRPNIIRESMPILTKSAAAEYGYALYADGDGEHPVPEGYITQGNGVHNYTDANEGLPLHAWSHVAATFDGAKFRIYVNGVLAETKSASIESMGKGPLTIGGASPLWPEDLFDGRIDELQIYGRALSEAEVDVDMATPLETAPTGPIAAWAFDENTGTTVQDVTGNGHTATIENGSWTSGKFGSAVKFNGLGGEHCVSVADSPALRLSEEFTLEAWVKPTGGVYEDPVVVKESGGSGAFGLGLGSRKNGKAEGFIGEGAGSKAALASESMGEHAWVHVATTYDGAELRLYVEGELVAEETAPTPPVTGEGPLKIGCDAADGQFTGAIDEVQVYNRALSGAEVDADMVTPLQTPKAGPLAEYSFDEGKGSTVEDLTGHGHTATIEGAEWSPTGGRYGGAMSFDGSKSSLVIPASPELNLTEEFTLEAWVRPEKLREFDDIFSKEEAKGSHFAYLMSDHHRQLAAYFGKYPEKAIYSPGEEVGVKTWTHVALVDSGRYLRLYINGEAVETHTAPTIISTEGGVLRIGGNLAFGSENDFDGRIDEVRIYGRALSEGEVATDMATPLQTPKVGPVAAWSFEEGEGTSVQDVTGHGHTATIEGARWARGRFGDGLQFDGEEACVTVPSSEALALGEEFTLQAWVKPEGTASSFDDDPLIVKRAGSFFNYKLGIGLAETGSPEGWVGLKKEATSHVAGSAPVEPNVWEHLGLTYDGAHLHLYVNGQLVASKSASSVEAAGGGDLTIGCDKASNEFFKGRLDEVKIYNWALSKAEMAVG